jgi:hypothetical protein
MEYSVLINSTRSTESRSKEYNTKIEFRGWLPTPETYNYYLPVGFSGVAPAGCLMPEYASA